MEAENDQTKSAGVVAPPPPPSTPPSSGPVEKVSETGVQEAPHDTEQYPSGIRLAAILIALAICVFLMPLDTVRFYPHRKEGKKKKTPATFAPIIV
jgi:hypothetical protein